LRNGNSIKYIQNSNITLNTIAILSRFNDKCMFTGVIAVSRRCLATFSSNENYRYIVKLLMMLMITWLARPLLCLLVSF